MTPWVIARRNIVITQIILRDAETVVNHPVGSMKCNFTWDENIYARSTDNYTPEHARMSIADIERSTCFRARDLGKFMRPLFWESFPTKEQVLCSILTTSCPF